MLRAYKYQIYPNKEQQEQLEMFFGAVRWVYNWGLEQKISQYNETKKSDSCFGLINKLTKLKETDEFGWLNNAPAQALQMSLRNLDNSFTAFFRHQNKFPSFKSKKKDRKSIQFPQNVRVDFGSRSVSIPKLKEVKMAKDRKFEGTIKTSTVSKTPTGRYYISILVEDGLSLPVVNKIDENKTIGIDLGVKDFAILSDGTKIKNDRFLNKQLIKLAVHQRRLSRKQKGSKNYVGEKIRVAKIHERVTFQRKDFQHKLSSKLAYDNQVTAICMENLSVEDMLKNKLLARNILDVGWSQFVAMIKYKCEWAGKAFVQIGRFESSSKTCSCGCINEELKLSDRVWTCKYCGSTHDRDILAANNIKLFGLETARRGGHHFVDKQSLLEGLSTSSDR